MKTKVLRFDPQTKQHRHQLFINNTATKEVEEFWLCSIITIQLVGEEKGGGRSDVDSRIPKMWR